MQWTVKNSMQWISNNKQSIVNDERPITGSSQHRRQTLLHCILPTAYCILSLTAYCQAQPIGHFLTDTIELGRPFQYALTVRHPAAQDVFFPDTARQFAPFLVRNMVAFPTQTLANVSTDSAVYTLVSFEVSRARVLQVPVYLANKEDCTAVLSLPDTVFLRSSLPITNQPDTLGLATQTELVPLPQQFNYPYLALVATGVGVFIGAIYILFGKALQRRWQRFQLARRHKQFLAAYNQLTRNLGPESAQETSNAAIVLWKQYLERVERQPYTSLTSREIADRIRDDRVADALRETDRIVYGGSFTDQSPLALRTLRDVAVNAYERKLTKE